MTPLHSAEILSVGTELLLGEVVDTNSAWLATQLAERGVDVLWSQRVGDNRERIAAAIRQALERSDLVLMSGGLGPTEDDLTREAVSDVAGETPVIDPDLERDLRDRFARFSRHMPDMNLKQAWRIPSSEILANPLGTAPGWLVRLTGYSRGGLIAALPGPPRELKRMWLEEVLPRLAFPQAGFHARLFKTAGLGESAVAERLAEFTHRANPSVATYAHRDGVHVRVAAKAGSAEEAALLAKPVEQEVQARLGDWVWGYDGEELPILVLEAFATRRRTLATFEQATAGLLANLLSSVPDGNRAYLGGVVAWSLEAMIHQGPLRQAEAASSPETVAQHLARAVREQFRADVGVAACWSTAPSAEDPAVAVVAIDVGSDVVLRELRLPPLGLAWQRERAAYATLALLRSLSTETHAPRGRTTEAETRPWTNERRDP